MSAYSEKMADGVITPHEEYEDENQLREFFKFVREYFEVEQKWDEVQQFGVDHPIASVFLIVTMVLCALPVLMFTLFITGSLVVSVTGFLFFEGKDDARAPDKRTIIALASFFLGGVLLFTGLFAIGVSVFLLVGYHLVVGAGNLLGNVKSRMPSIPCGEQSWVSKHSAKKD